MHQELHQVRPLGHLGGTFTVDAYHFNIYRSIETVTAITFFSMLFIGVVVGKFVPLPWPESKIAWCGMFVTFLGSAIAYGVASRGRVATDDESKSYDAAESSRPIYRIGGLYRFLLGALCMALFAYGVFGTITLYFYQLDVPSEILGFVFPALVFLVFNYVNQIDGPQ